MQDKLRQNTESAGSRGFEVKFTGEDYYDLYDIFESAKDLQNLKPADDVCISFQAYNVPELSRGVSKFALFRDFNASTAFVNFSGKNGQLNTVDIHVVDQSDPLRTVVLERGISNNKEYYSMQDLHKSIKGADPAYVRDIMYHILLQQEDSHVKDFSFQGMFEYFKLLHPERTEIQEFKASNEILLDGYLNSDGYNFCFARSEACLKVENWFSGDYRYFSQPIKTEIEVSASTVMPIVDSYKNGCGNLHMTNSRYSLEAYEEAGDNIPTITSAICTSVVEKEYSDIPYGPAEDILANNLGTIQAQNDAKLSTKYLQKISDAVWCFKK